MRHAAADDAAASLHDFDRTLTTKGRKRAHDVAKALLAAKEVPDLIISSPLVRALQTAEIVASVVAPPEPVGVRQELTPEGRAQALVLELCTAGIKSVMLVGHEPGVSSLMHDLVGESGWNTPFAKSMVVALKVDDSGAAKVRWILEPKSLHITPLR